MSNKIALLSIFFALLFISSTVIYKKHYKLVDGYILVQKESRRNESTQWQLVWEEEFNKNTLDTNRWSRIDLFTSPKWKTPIEMENE